MKCDTKTKKMMAGGKVMPAYKAGGKVKKMAAGGKTCSTKATTKRARGAKG